jgi:hypothetical protein
MSLAESYKLVRFVGHGILNRAKDCCVLTTAMDVFFFDHVFFGQIPSFVNVKDSTKTGISSTSTFSLNHLEPRKTGILNIKWEHQMGTYLKYTGISRSNI